MAASLVLGAGTTWAGAAHASPSFPRVMSRALSLDCEPSCAVCHKGATGFGTTNTPFGTKMRREARLSCCDDDALEDALGLFEERGIDSDEDGTPDVAELVAGTDPNGEGALACERPYQSDGSRVFGDGCSASPRARTSRPADPDATAIVLTVALLGLVVRLRTRRARS